MTPRAEDPDRPAARARRSPARPRRVPLRAPDGPLAARIQPLDRPPRRGQRVVSRNRLARFMDQFGWRAYAIPVLAVASVLLIGNIAGGVSDPKPPAGNHAAGPPQTPATSPSPSAPSSAAAPHSPDTSAAGAPPSNGQDAAGKPSPGAGVDEAALPSGPPVPQRGTGAFTVVPGTSEVAGHGPLKRYAVEVEAGMSGVNAKDFADAVAKTLGDKRSWTRSGLSLQRVDSGPIDFRVTLTSVLTIRAMCGYEIKVETSCYNGSQGRAFINVARWIRGAVAYDSNLAAYRHYVINHEVGHALGHGHMKCPKAGSPAPLMMEQTLGITTPGVGACRPNPWPYVDGRYITGPPTKGA